jgi:enamine deaminase RidA (YjgF/YER057c/UK114 family)
MPKRDWKHPDLAASPGFSRALEVPQGRTIYFSGQVPTDGEGKTVGAGDLGVQADVCFAKIKGMLELAGGTMGDIVKVNMFVTDIGRMGEVMAVRERYFTAEPYPAMTGVEIVALNNPDWMIEVEAIAVVE